MKLTYIYQSGFALEWDGFSILTDYCRDSSGETGGGYVHGHLLKRPGTLYILVSHSHTDHFNPEIFNWQKEKNNIVYILSKDIAGVHSHLPEGAIILDKLQCWEDSRIKVQAFGSTDIGISFLVETGGKKIFHAGDLNNWHWEEESTPEEVKGYETNYLDELELLAQTATHLDIAMFPVDPRLGKDYARGARQFIDRIKTDWFIPMHFWEKYDKAAAFKEYALNKGCKFATWTHPGESIEII